MKTIIRYFSKIVLFLALLVGCTQTFDNDNTISVQDYRNQDFPDSNFQAHKSGDVYVYRSLFIDEGYSVVFYSDITGELLSHKAFYGTEEDFDRAKFEWKNDTTVIIGLINSETDKEISFEVFGKGSTTGMSIDI